MSTETKPVTLGDLMCALVEYEIWKQKAAEANNKVKAAPVVGTRDCFYALRSSEYSQQAISWKSVISNMAGYDQLRVICEARWGQPPTTERLRILRGELCLAAGQSISELDKIQLTDFAGQLTNVAMGGGSTASTEPNASAASLVETVAETVEEPFTPFQVSILRALNGRALKKESLCAEIKCEGSRLYKDGGIKELIDSGHVKNKKGLGYYRPDKPPPQDV